MCRCLQNLWEDCYWHCIEEKFCFDKDIAYYNPDEDEAAQQNTKKNALDIEFVPGDRKNSEIIVNQPLARHCSVLGSKVHEDEFQREIQTTVPILAPEVMAAFATSQIFHEHSQKPKAALTRIETKAKITAAEVLRTGDQDGAAEKLLSRLEGINVEEEEQGGVVFKLADEELSMPARSKTFTSIAEEEDDDEHDMDQVDLRPKALHYQQQREMSRSSQNITPAVSTKQAVNLRLKHVQSVPQLSSYPASMGSGGGSSSTSIRPWSQAGETMTKDGIFIINTPELPAISLRKLPRNYLDTPSIEQYPPISSSLTSIQVQNQQRVDNQFNFQMPRYYGHSEMYLPTPAISQEEINRSNLRAKQSRVSLKKNRSMVNLRSGSPDAKSIGGNSVALHRQMSGSGGDLGPGGRAAVEKSKRLKLLRGNLPPLMIQTKDSDVVERDRH